MEMTEAKRWKPKQYRTTMAWGPYPNGFVFEPTGIYRDRLLARKLIEPVEPERPKEEKETEQHSLFRKNSRGRK